MATIKLNGLAKDDLQWQLKYDTIRCTFCGKCIASCPFGSIEAGVEKRRKVISEGATPTPKVVHQTVPVIKQVVHHQKFCRGCGTCEKICPNDAIKPVRNNDNRFPIKYRGATADSFKRAGRTNLHTEGRTLDKIKVGRISQMTDPDRSFEKFFQP